MRSSSGGPRPHSFPVLVVKFRCSLQVIGASTNSESTRISTGEHGCMDLAWSSTIIAKHTTCVLISSVYMALLPCYLKFGSTPHCHNGRQYRMYPLPRILWVITGRICAVLPKDSQAWGSPERGYKVGLVCTPCLPQPTPSVVVL